MTTKYGRAKIKHPLLVIVRKLDPDWETFSTINVQADSLHPDVLVQDSSEK